MLEIVRGRSWSVVHTLYDSLEGPLTDLSVFDEYRCQIREKSATRNSQGYFEHAVVANVVVTANVPASQLTLSLTRNGAALLHTGDYQIDLLGLRDGADEALLQPEPVRVTNRPSSTVEGDFIPQEVSTPIPDFSETYNEALED